MHKKKKKKKKKINVIMIIIIKKKLYLGFIHRGNICCTSFNICRYKYCIIYLWKLVSATRLWHFLSHNSIFLVSIKSESQKLVRYKVGNCEIYRNSEKKSENSKIKSCKYEKKKNNNNNSEKKL